MVRNSILVAVAFLLAACSRLDTQMSASTDINPDINGNPSPIAVSVFELSDPSAFMAADFIHLYANPSTTLGSSLLVERNLMLVPGTTEIVSLPAIKGVKAIAYVAAYQDLVNTHWREWVSVAPTMFQGENITIQLNNQGIRLVSTERSFWNNL